MATINIMTNKIFFKNKQQKGYAILFTVVIVSAISVITAGLTNAAYKQLILSSLAKDSQLAFYQADTAGDCALYADRIRGVIPGAWTCGGLNLNVAVVGTGYTIYPTSPNVTTPCFRIDVTETVLAGPITETSISAKGYNICNTSNVRTVEREIKIKFSE